MLRRGGTAAHVAGSQVALAASNYLVLAIAARHLDPAGFAAVSAYYLLINTVGRGLFAAVELETTRAVAAGARGMRAAAAHRRAARRRAGAARARAPLLTGGASAAAIALLAVGAVDDGGVLPGQGPTRRAAALRPLRRHVLDRGGRGAGGGGGADGARRARHGRLDRRPRAGARAGAVCCCGPGGRGCGSPRVQEWQPT